MASVGNIFDYFRVNQLIKFSAV